MGPIRVVQRDGHKDMGLKKDLNIWVKTYGSKETGPNRRIQRDRSKMIGPNKLVKEDRMVQIYPNWSNMVQNQPKKCPNGSGITRFPGLVFFLYLQGKPYYWVV